ncbi:vacuolar segregation protein PEP7-like isoform X6 [Patiria miniata]|uniref:FYVE-type domain-containing protein n=1 Tax=Patiria miniata TaxID=46514 RepID=A0A913ZEX0_PATMI|nr:vacuolar segregation protein PEP7-like isoform X6 [Patiria miniata]
MASAFPPTTPTSPIDRSAWRSAYRSESFVNVDDQELAQVRSQLQTFVSQHQDSNTDYTEGAITITKLHWINSSQRSKCHNSSCKLKFTLTQRKHHCRKCGEVFCAKCLQYQRKLSPTAEYDPNGKLYMVCAVCFNSETQGRGQARFWTQTFAEMRRDYLAERARFIDSTNTKPTRPYLLKECQRLVDGFSKNQTSINPTQTGKEAENEDVTKASKFFKRLGSLTTKVSKVPSLVKTGPPEWQKPDTWVPNGPNCQFCGTAFTYKKHNCYICGRLVCLTCSCKDLLIYVPDKCNHEHEGKHARWAVIKIIGSPEIEPDKRLYVRTCKVCLEELTALQVDNYKASMNGEDKDQDCMSKMMEIHGNITKFQDKIDEMLPKYKQLIDSLEIAADSPKSLPPTRNNMQVLAKHQGDLADHFTSFVVAVSRLKQLKPRTQTQLKLVKLLMRSKFSYYSDSMYTFRQLKKRLEQISPPEVLQAIQSIVDSQAINSTCLFIGQLSYESLHICLKYELSEELPTIFKDAYEVCLSDLQKIIEEQKKDWEQRKKEITNFIKVQLTGGEGVDMAPCLYLQPSQRYVQRYGTTYVDNYLFTRCEEITGQILLQLQSRCAYRKFQKTKDSLAWLKQSIKDLQAVTRKNLEVDR